MHASIINHAAILRYHHLEYALRVRNKNLYRKVCAQYQLKGKRGIKEILHVIPFILSKEFSFSECKQIYDSRSLMKVDIGEWPLSNFNRSKSVNWHLRELMLTNFAAYSIVKYGCLRTTMDPEIPIHFSRAPVGTVLDLGWLDLFFKYRPGILNTNEVDMVYAVSARVWDTFISVGLDFYIKEESPVGKLMSNVCDLLAEYRKDKALEVMT